MDDTIRNRIREMVLGHAEKLRPERGTYDGRTLWQAVRSTGTRLWLDTGDMDEADSLWCDEFSGLTTNNTLLNREVQKGTYDELVGEIWTELKGSFDPKGSVIEIAFVLNAVHALRLVARFGCKVSVELHTDVANDVDATVAYGRRYFEICPESFIIKVPLTPAGLIATRRLSDAGVPVNFTLGFGARQNFLAAAFSRPRYVNVFLGRLNSFVADNGLGDGRNVGERATLASQRAVREASGLVGGHTLQIAASMRAGEQVGSLAGVDVFTMPPKVAGGFMSLHPDAPSLQSRVEEQPEVTFAPDVDAKATGLTSFWDVPERFKAAALGLTKESPDDLTPDAVCEHFARQGLGGFLPAWPEQDVAAAREDGKIPKLPRWKERLGRGEVALDALMNLSALMSFTADQAEMDGRIQGLLA